MVVVAVSIRRPGLGLVDTFRSSASVVNSYKGHMVDALAAGGDEGRRSLRKAPGSGQARDNPEMSEWGNPAHDVRHPQGSQPRELKHLSTWRKRNQTRFRQ